MKKFEPVVRWMLILIALAWAAAKIYLLSSIIENATGVVENTTPVWLHAILIMAAFCYAGTAYSLIKTKYLLFGLFLIAALATNSALFALTQFQFLRLDFQPVEKLTWFFAVISEEYFMWISILFGAAIMLVLRNFDRARAILWTTEAVG